MTVIVKYKKSNNAGLDNNTNTKMGRIASIFTR